MAEWATKPLLPSSRGPHRHQLFRPASASSAPAPAATKRESVPHSFERIEDPHALALHVRQAQHQAAKCRRQVLSSEAPPPRAFFPRLALDGDNAERYNSLPLSLRPPKAPPQHTEDEIAAAAAESRRKAALASVSNYVERLEGLARSRMMSKMEVRGIAPKRDWSRICEEAGEAAAKARLRDAAAYAKTLAHKKTGRVPKHLDRNRDWVRLGGVKLEASLEVDPSVGQSPIRLVDSRFLITLAHQRCPWPNRNAIPDTAFVPLSMLREMPPAVDSQGHRSLRVCFVSLTHLTPDHPDPLLHHQMSLAATLEKLNDELGEPHGAYAVFLGYCSVLQPSIATQSPLAQRLPRCLQAWYTHPASLLVQLTRMPPEYPSGYTFSQKYPNIANYYARGWTFCEACLGHLAKPKNLILDVGSSDQAHRRPPLTPEQFSIALDSKSFHDKADAMVVKDIYRRAFENLMAEAHVLDFRNRGWGDAEVIALCQVLRDAAPHMCRRIDLEGNQLSPRGIAALADSMQQQKLGPAMSRIWIGSGQTKDDSYAYTSRPYLRNHCGELGFSSVNALVVHRAWDATQRSGVRIEGGVRSGIRQS